MKTTLLAIGCLLLVGCNTFEKTNYNTWDDASLLQRARDPGDVEDSGKAFDILAHRNLDGEKEIRRMLPAIVTKGQKTEGDIGGAFFVFGGAISGHVDSHPTAYTTITFAWKMHDGAYAITTLPLDAFRVKLVENQKNPTASFVWSYGYGESKLLSSNRLSEMIKQVTITTNPKDWPSRITLPLS